MTNSIRKPEELFVRCSWHKPRGVIVLRKNGKIPDDVLLSRLDELLPQSHGVCESCEKRIYTEEMLMTKGRCANGI